MDGVVGQSKILLMDGGLRPVLRLMTIAGGGIILQQQLTMKIKRMHRALLLAGEVVGVVVAVVMVVAEDAGYAAEVGTVETVETVEDVETAAVVVVFVVVVVVVVDTTLTHKEERIAGRTKSPARITRLIGLASRGFDYRSVVVR